MTPLKPLAEVNTMMCMGFFNNSVLVIWCCPSLVELYSVLRLKLELTLQHYIVLGVRHTVISGKSELTVNKSQFFIFIPHNLLFITYTLTTSARQL